MKILHVVHAYKPAIGGTEFLVQQVSEYMANDVKEDVTVFTTFAYNTALFTNPGAPSLPPERQEEILNGVKIRRFPVKNRWGRLLYYFQYIFYRLRLWGNGRLRMLFYGPIAPEMKKAIKESDADIIIAAPFPLNHMNYVFKNRGRKPVVLIGCIHTADKHGFHNRRIIKNIKKAAGYVALTQYEKDYLVQQWGIPEKKIRVIGVGLDIVQEQVTGEPENNIRKELGIPKTVPLIAFVGQHGLHKGIETLLLAMPTIWKTSPNVRLLIAGGTSHFSNLFKELANFIEQGTWSHLKKKKNPDLSDKRIFFLDNIDDSIKNSILATCDIFAAPSGFESFGITILEAWKHKKPVVACRIPAAMNLIEEYKTGLLVDYKNPLELACALNELVVEQRLRKLLGENGFGKLKKTYAREVVGNQYYKFYREVLGRED
ncbi:MAG: glycosyltransferase family 4 protein [Acidobacteria bacterium]|jgi:glycosyltransferase involved in cell wall biosynthesis|nr:glycosyltransferase family 4 protein [Acidobacteriota bacterium]